MSYQSYQIGKLNGFAIFDLAIQILAIIGNSLVLAAAVNVKIGLVGFRRFLISLLANNLLLSVSQVFIAVYLELDGAIFDLDNSCVSAFLESLKLFAVLAALFNLCGMSIDHFIGIIHPMKYDYIMNTQLAKIGPFLIWIFAFIFGFADIPVAAIDYHLYSYRSASSDASDYAKLLEVLITETSEAATDTPAFTRGRRNSDPFFFAHHQGIVNSLRDIDADLLVREQTDWCLISHSYKLYIVQWFRLFCTIAVFIFIVIFYGRIFREIRHKNNNTILAATAVAVQLQIQKSFDSQNHGDNNSNNSNNSKKAGLYSALIKQQVNLTAQQRRSSRKFVRTTLSLLGAFAICWLPFIVVEISSFRQNRPNWIRHLLNSLFLLYPLIDSIICLARLDAVRRYLWQAFMKCCCSSHLPASFNGTRSDDYHQIEVLPSPMGSGPSQIVAVNNCATHERHDEFFL